VALLRKKTNNLRHPMDLCHPAYHALEVSPAKEPYISAKEPCISQKRFPVSDALMISHLLHGRTNAEARHTCARTHMSSTHTHTHTHTTRQTLTSTHTSNTHTPEALHKRHTLRALLVLLALLTLLAFRGVGKMTVILDLYNYSSSNAPPMKTSRGLSSKRALHFRKRAVYFCKTLYISTKEYHYIYTTILYPTRHP